MNNCFRIFLLVVTACLLPRAGSAGVGWLRLGSPTAPVLAADGSILQPEQLAACQVWFVDQQGRFLGSGDLSGLDQAGDGFFLGVVHVAVEADTIATMRLMDSLTGQSASLGPGLVRGDDFAPRLDLASHRLEAAELTWRDVVTLTVNSTGGGQVVGESGLLPPDTRVELVAQPHPFHEFLRWEGGVPAAQASDSTVELLLVADLVVTAVFGLQVPDDWRLRHFQTVDVDLEADDDMDEYSNREEFAFGTDPRSAAAAQQRIRLEPGWNLVALAVLPPRGEGRGEPFQAEGIGPIYEWEGLAGRFAVATAVQPLSGAWVFAATAIDIVIDGQPVVDPVVRLHRGWDLAAPGMAVLLPDQPAVNGRVWLWDRQLQGHRRRWPESELAAGAAVWIHGDSHMLLPFSSAVGR